MIESPGPLCISTIAFDFLLVSLKISLIGFFSWLLGNICDGAKRMRSTCLPGMVINFGPEKALFEGEDSPPLTEPGVANPGDGEDMREELLLEARETICGSFDIPLDAAVAAGPAVRAPQAIGIAAVTRGFGPLPKAGNNSSDRTSSTGAFLEFGLETGVSRLALEIDSSPIGTEAPR
jgi:hypothetical protein